jgi:hypothetical protein
LKYIGGKLKRDEKTEDPEQTKIGLTRTTLTDMRNKISADGRLSESFGVRQGDPLSTMLFTRVLEAVFTFQRQQNLHARNSTVWNKMIYIYVSWREKRLEMAFPMLPMLKIRTL